MKEVNMKLAVFTVCIPDYTPQQAVSLLRELGYEGIEWRVVDQSPTADGKPGFWAGNLCTWPLTTFIQDASAIRALAESAQLEIPLVGSYVSCTDPDAVGKIMQGAAILGASMVRVRVLDYDGQSSYVKTRNQCRTYFRDVAALAEQYGRRAVIETHHGSIVPSASAAASLLDGFDPRWVGVIYDPANQVIEGYEPYRMGLGLLGPYLAHVHLKNTAWRIAGVREDGSTSWEPVFVPLNKGILNIKALFENLVAVGYDGWVSLEDFSTDEPTRKRLQNAMAFIKQIIR
jgi:sugar phosphate isomerase/epimerase